MTQGANRPLVGRPWLGAGDACDLLRKPYVRWGALLGGLWFALAAAQEPAGTGSQAAQRLLASGSFEDAEAAARAAVGRAHLAAADAPGELANASDVLVSAMIANGRAALDETVALALANLHDREVQVGTDSAALLPALLNLGDALTAVVKSDQATLIGTRAVALSERVHGADSLELATALDHQGAALVGAGRHEEALAALERSLGLKMGRLPATDVAIARTLEDMAFVLQRQGDYVRAGERVRRAVAIQGAANPRHPAYVKTLNVLADQLWFEGDLLASKEASERALALAEATLRAEHPTIASTLATLAGTLADIGDLQESLALKQRVYAIAVANFGDDHLITVEYLLRARARRDAIWRLCRGAQTRSASPDQIRVSVWRAARVCRDQPACPGPDRRLARRLRQRPSRAGTSGRASFTRGRATHPFVAMALMELARILNEQGRPGQALPLLERALAIRQQRLGPEHRDVALTLADLASTLIAVGRSSRARCWRIKRWRSGSDSTPPMPRSSPRCWRCTHTCRQPGRISGLHSNTTRGL